MGTRVVVVGSINMDVVISTSRLPALGETVLGGSVAFHPGGKGANQAVAAAKLGARCSMIGAVGDDPFGHRLLAFLTEAGVDVARVTVEPAVATGVASITLTGGDNAIVVAPGANALVADVTPDDIAAGDVVLTQLEIPVERVRDALVHARARGATTILNAAPARACPGELLAATDVLVVNEHELSALASASVSDVAEAARAARVYPAQRVVVTLGARGIVAIDGDRVIEVSAPSVDAIDTTGAGDCFAGALAARLGRRDPLDAALRYAVTAAAICVQRSGAGPSMPSAVEVDAALGRARG